jgi:hypothetical protein
MAQDTVAAPAPSTATPVSKPDIWASYTPPGAGAASTAQDMWSGYQPPVDAPPATLAGTIATGLGDSVKAAGAGVAGLAQMGLNLGYGLTGSTAMKHSADWLGEKAQAIDKTMSPEMQEAAKKEWIHTDEPTGADQDNAWDWFKSMHFGDAVSDPRSWLYQIANQGGSALAGGALGKVVGLGAETALGLSKLKPALQTAGVVGQTAEKAALASGVEAAEAAQAGKSAAQSAFTDAAAKVGVENASMDKTVKQLYQANFGSQMAEGTYMHGADAAYHAMETIAQMPHDELMKSPAYAQAYQGYISAGEDEAKAQSDAKEDIRRAAGKEAASVTASFALPFQAVLAHVNTKLFNGGMGATSRLGNVGKALGMETPSNAAELGMVAFGSNVGVKDYAKPDMHLSEGVANTAMSAAVGAGGMAIPHMLSPVQPAIEAAKTPNSPLSRATVASHSGPVVDPEFAAAQAKQQSDQTASAEAQAPAAEPEKPVDPLADRVRAVTEAARANGTLDALRGEGSPIPASAFVKDLSVAQSTSTNPALREQALGRLEYASSWAGYNPAATAPSGVEQTVIPATEGSTDEASRGTQLQSQFSQATTDFDRQNILNQIDASKAQAAYGSSKAINSVAADAQSTGAVAGITQQEQDRLQDASKAGQQHAADAPRQLMISRALKAIDERQGVASPDEASLLHEQGLGKPYDRIDTSLTSSPRQDLILPGAPAVSASASLQQNRAPNASVERAFSPTLGVIAPRNVTAPRVAVPSGEGNAIHRKRTATLVQLIKDGLSKVERRVDGFYLVNANRRRQFRLEGPADAQLARKAVNDVLHAGANEANTSPSEAQAAAGNYKKGRVEFDGLKIGIENPIGSARTGVDPSGKPWSVEMKAHYGDLTGTVGKDGDGVDVYLVDHPHHGAPVFVVDQYNGAKFDEHKAIIGASSEAQALAVYDAHFSDGSGPLRRGAVTAMSASEFKAWAESPAAKKPAGENHGPIRQTHEQGVTQRAAATAPDIAAGVVPAQSESGRQNAGGGIPYSGAHAGDVAGLAAADHADDVTGHVTIRVDGATRQVSLVEPASDSSERRPGGGRQITKGNAEIMHAIGQLFGKRVQFFRDTTLGDGFVYNQHPQSIFLNEHSTVSPLAVFGHELLHKVEVEMPEVHAALVKVVNTHLKEGGRAAFRKDYSKDQSGNDAPLTAAELNEITSDMGGNLMSDTAFWKDVFDQVQADHPGSSKGLIAKLAEQLYRLIDHLLVTIKQPNFRSTDLVNDLATVRAAFKDGLAKYVSENGFGNIGMQAEILRASQKAKQSTSRASTPSTSHSPETGIHFSKQQRSSIDGRQYGSGMKGQESYRLQSATDPRLHDRSYFYIDQGDGVKPEDNVGSQAHEVTLPRLYDAKEDPEKLWNGGDLNGTESRILDAGYHGYHVRGIGRQQGAAVVMGAASHALAATPIAGWYQGAPAADILPVKVSRGLLGKELNAIDASAIPGAQLRNGTLTVPLASREVANSEMERIGSAVRFSPARAEDGAASEYATIDAKFRGTDQWMKTPMGGATALSERQWVHVRTPAFRAWFGDWEKAHAEGGVWNDASNSVSKVVGPDGEPLVVYHGTDKGGFTAFNTPSGKDRGDLGIFTTSNLDMAESYVRKGRSKEINLGSKSRSELEDAGFQFEENDDGVEATDVDGYRMDGPDSGFMFRTMADAVAEANRTYAGTGDQTHGVYALFANIRNPNESDFEGATWSGERNDQYVVINDEGETLYSKTGYGFFRSEEEAQAVADEQGGNVEPAPEHYESTDSVVREARKFKNDGAMITSVIDDGGGSSRYNFEPSDVFVAFDPSQLKSADYNNGSYSVNQDDVRHSPRRPKREQAGDYEVTPEKDGSLTVHGTAADIRAAVPENVLGRITKEGVRYSGVDAPRVRSALEGSSIAYSRQGVVLKQMPIRNGKYLGAPDKFNTPGKIPALRKLLRQLADEGAPGRYWYENSSREILRMVGGDVQEARRFVALLAIYSPQAKVDTNSTFALRAWSQYKAGQLISVKTGVMDRKAQAAMADVEGFWQGEKTGNFITNLLIEIDPATKGKQGATIDMWMMRAGQYSNDAPTKTQYAFMENEANRLAQELGWEPQQVQAAIWVAMKARMENSDVKKATEVKSAKKGWIHYDTKGLRVVPPATAQQHRDNWLDHALKHEVTQGDTATAKFDFADGVQRHLGLVSWEARPGRSTGVLPGIHKASYAQQVEFQQAVQQALQDEHGNDLLAMHLGLLVDSDILAPGVWQGEVSPSSQKSVAMAPAGASKMVLDHQTDQRLTVHTADALDAKWKINPRFEAVRAVDPTQHQMLNTYAAALGLLTHQEGVGWHRPFYSSTKAKANGLYIKIGRPISKDEISALYTAIDGWMQQQGKVDWMNQFAIISAPTGVRLVNFGIIDNAMLHSDLIKAAEKVLPSGYVDSFASDGDMPSNNWKDNPHGQTYIQRIGKEGRSDILGWLRGVLAPRVQSVFNDFSAKYDWGNPGHIDFGGGAGEAAGRADPLAVSDAGGLRRSLGRMDQSGRSDQGNGRARESDGSLQGLPRQVAGFTPSHWAPAARVAEQYMQQAGLTYRPPATFAKVDPARAARIAEAYEQMADAPHDPQVQKAYAAMIREVETQYQAVLDSGLKVEFIDFAKQGDPYAASPRMSTEDVRDNNHLWVFSTKDGFGSSDLDVSSNPMLAETVHLISGQPALANDLFRIVHDYFGHVKEGLGFRADGEENAWRAHSAMFSPLARRALTTETRGQNSWVNYGPKGDANRTANVGETHYADQKVGLLPQWVTEEGAGDEVQQSPTRIADADKVELRKRASILEAIKKCMG